MFYLACQFYPAPSETKKYVEQLEPSLEPPTYSWQTLTFKPYMKGARRYLLSVLPIRSLVYFSCESPASLVGRTLGVSVVADWAVAVDSNFPRLLVQGVSQLVATLILGAIVALILVVGSAEAFLHIDVLQSLHLGLEVVIPKLVVEESEKKHEC